MPEGALPVVPLREYLPRVEVPLRVQGGLALAHHLEALPVLAFHEPPLANPDAMLPSGRALEVQRPIHDGLVGPLHARPPLLVLRISHDHHMQIPIASVSEGVARHALATH